VPLNLDALGENRVEAAGAAEISEGAVLLICMFCAFASHPEIVAALQQESSRHAAPSAKSSSAPDPS